MRTGSAFLVLVLLAGCAGEDPGAASAALSHGRRRTLVREVRRLAADHDITPIPPAPAVSDEMFALGQALMFDKEISGNRDISCMTCHFPTLGTDDDRHLALGVNGVDQGAERVAGSLHPRNVLPLFNLHAMPRMFWDMRVEDDGHGGIRTEAGPEITPEMQDVFEFGPASAVGMFPVLVRGEMRGQRFHNGPSDNELEGDLERPEVWSRIMQRLGAIPQYRAMFEAAYPGTSFDDMSFAHASNAMAGFEIRAFEARGSRWNQFLEGDDSALNDAELQGARIFLREGCANCHSGPLLSDMQSHNTGLAQFGPGTEDGQYDNDDFGRASARAYFPLSQDRDGPAGVDFFGEFPEDRYEFRTAPLVNVSLTGPWGHIGQFSSLRDFIRHYDDPAAQLRNYDMEAQIDPSEAYLLEMRLDNSDEVIPRIDPLANVGVSDVDLVLTFLGALTDDDSRDLAWTVPSSVPSGLPVLDGEAPPPERGLADGTVTFTDITPQPHSGLSDYHRVPSARNAIAEAEREASLTTPMHFLDIFDTPLRWRGMPGVALFDYDNDGDEDVFVTNGPGAPNSLFQNQLVQTGRVRFIDRGVAAGVAATDTDNSGACYGDIDNDGDHDLFVVADHGRSHLFRNSGDGTFEDISAASGTNVDSTGGTSCAFGDIDGDGLLDLFVARGWHQENVYACFTDPFGSGIQHNELYLNTGGGTFTDVSNASGIRNLGGLPPFAAGAPTITWSVSMVDYDADGDVDIFTADDQCALPPAAIGGVDRGFLQIFDNDGTGNFTNRTVEAGTNQPSPWMGLSWADFNSDGYLDFFSPSFGDWAKPFAGAPVILGYETSRWFLGGPGKTFTNPGPGDIQRMPFGWSTTARDFDNDGDTDLTFHGGLDLWFHVDRSNAGTMLINDGDANFGIDPAAFGASHARRNDAGGAAGDLDHNGFPDVVTASNFDIPAAIPIAQYGGADTDVQYHSPLDPISYFVGTFELNDANDPAVKFDRLFRWNEDIVFPDGTVAVELNGGNGNGWAAVRVAGSVGLVTGGRSNRDGIGAMLYFTPEGGRTVMAPVLGGASHLSQDSLTQNFGLGAADRGMLEILWPGGTRNRVYDVESHERLVVPEIPCSYDTDASRPAYATCVNVALAQLVVRHRIDLREAVRLRWSALRAYDDAH